MRLELVNAIYRRGRPAVGRRAPRGGAFNAPGAGGRDPKGCEFSDRALPEAVRTTAPGSSDAVAVALPPQQVRQLRDVGCNAPCFAPTWLAVATGRGSYLEIDVY